KVGFDRLDFGSFVSPRVMPQMQDTATLMNYLDEGEPFTSTLLAIVANTKGALEAAKFGSIGILGFPFSISETFQQRNTNSSIEQSLRTVKDLISICYEVRKTPLVYLSMGFGNPYGDEWNEDIVVYYTDKLIALGITEIRIADTTGVSTPEKINQLFALLKRSFPTASLGLHLHSKPVESIEKLEAALDAGCTQFDTALRGFGGCPMADDELTGNIATECLIALLTQRDIAHHLQMDAWEEALAYSNEIFKSS